MKAETSEGPKSQTDTGRSTVAPSPDTASAREQTESTINCNDSPDNDDTAMSATLTVESASEAGKSHKGDTAMESISSNKSSDLVGKINNLVSSDMESIVNARDFIMIIVSPIQIGLCVLFLWEILGWRWGFNFVEFSAL
jgi:hypothetical protein